MQHIRALAHSRIEVVRRGVKHGHVLPGERKEARSFAFQRKPPCRGCLIGVCRTEIRKPRHCPQRHQVFDRLMCRPVFAQRDRVVCEYEERVDLHQGSQPDGRLGIVRKHKEGRSEGDQPAVSGNSIHRGAHAKLAHAKEDVAPRRVYVKALPRLEDRPGR